MGEHRFRHLRRMTPARWTSRALDVDTGSALIVLARHPRPNVCGTIAKDNTTAGFVLSQEVNGVTIREDQIRKIQDKDVTSRLGVD